MAIAAGPYADDRAVAGPRVLPGLAEWPAPAASTPAAAAGMPWAHAAADTAAIEVPAAGDACLDPLASSSPCLVLPPLLA